MWIMHTVVVYRFYFRFDLLFQWHSNWILGCENLVQRIVPRPCDVSATARQAVAVCYVALYAFYINRLAVKLSAMNESDIWYLVNELHIFANILKYGDIIRGIIMQISHYGHCIKANENTEYTFIRIQHRDAIII